MTSFIFGELKRISVISNELQALHHEHHADDDVHSLTKDKKVRKIIKSIEMSNCTQLCGTVDDGIRRRSR